MLAEDIIKNQAIKIELLEKRCEQYAQAYDSLLAEIKELQRHRFGKKSERYIDPKHAQLLLIGDNNAFKVADAEQMTLLSHHISVRNKATIKQKKTSQLVLKSFLSLTKKSNAHAASANKSSDMKQKK